MTGRATIRAEDMARTTRKGEAFTWHHVARPTRADVLFIANLFGMSQRDADMLADTEDLPRFYDRGDWHILRLHIPSVGATHSVYERLHLTFVYNKETVVTIVDGRIAALDQLAKQEKKRAMPRELRHGNVGDVMTWLVHEVLDDIDLLFETVHAHIERLAHTMRRLPSDSVTKQLGALRRDILQLDLMVEPGKAVVEQLLHTRAPYRPPRVVAALNGVCDRLHAMHTVLAHDGRVVDALFQEHESVLTHRTNQVVQLLTVISVLLMPPTLVASYYGMNVAGLPWAHDIRIVTSIVVLGILIFMVVIMRLLRK